MKLTHVRLRAMRQRWKRDLALLEEAFPVDLGREFTPEAETIRNLATAIGQVDGIITNKLPLNRRTLKQIAGRAALSGDKP